MAWASGLVAFALALVVVPAARWLAWRVGTVDVPRGHKAHSRAVALLGGPAVLAAVAVTLAALRPEELPWLLPAAALTLLGLADDLWGVRASLRLGVELVVCLVLLWATGTRLWTPTFVPGWLATVLTALWSVGVINAANCFDCADGSLAGVGGLAALGVAAVALLWGQHTQVAALALAGALGGFWLYNRPRATIFLGDAGSLPVGLLVGWMAVRTATERPAALTLAALLLVSVPVFDFVAVHLRRWRRLGLHGLMESVGREHLPHRLSQWGGVRGGLVALYALQAGSVLAALAAASSASPWPGLAALFVWVAVLLWVDDRLPQPEGRVEVPVAAPAPVRPEGTG